MEIRIKRIKTPAINEGSDLPDGTNTYLVIDNSREFVITCRFHIHGNSLRLAGQEGTLHSDTDTGKVYRQLVAPGGGCGLIITDEIVEGLSPWALRGIIIAEQNREVGEVRLIANDSKGIPDKQPDIFIDGIAADALNAQQAHWEKTFSEKVAMFGTKPSYPALRATELFKKEGAVRILELGGGQGRDTIFFANQGLQVSVLDYSKEGLKAIMEKAQESGISQSISILQHDIREPLPFEDESFDCCFSHMLYCMALATAELESLSKEISRVLKPGGLNMYTARNTGDAHYRTGIHRGEDMWEVGGFVVHFFSREKLDHLAKGYDMIGVEEFEEGDLPRKLFLVTLRKHNRF